MNKQLKNILSHYYNYEDFSNPNSFEVDIKVRIDTITDATANKTPLFDQVSIKTINVPNSDGIDIPHKLYYIIAREGIVSNPSVVDSVYITYKGMLTDNHIFDERNIQPVVRSWQILYKVLEKVLVN